MRSYNGRNSPGPRKAFGDTIAGADFTACRSAASLAKPGLGAADFVRARSRKVAGLAHSGRIRASEAQLRSSSARRSGMWDTPAQVLSPRPYPKPAGRTQAARPPAASEEVEQPPSRAPTDRSGTRVRRPSPHGLALLSISSELRSDLHPGRLQTSCLRSTTRKQDRRREGGAVLGHGRQARRRNRQGDDPDVAETVSHLGAALAQCLPP